ncbi:helix-turn-helix domain-containing protein [Streptomyces sp. NPDC058676]|uniref:helix-turn-helix domain-containing protein n=1 Tax=unclassified Streptomyces TaxID=2593676 RepID=UPI0036639B2F
MRYPQGGGLTPERQAFRERIRLEAAERFAAGASNAEVAKDLRVSVRSVQRWRRTWHDAGTEGLRSAGPRATRVMNRRWISLQDSGTRPSETGRRAVRRHGPRSGRHGRVSPR